MACHLLRQHDLEDSVPAGASTPQTLLELRGQHWLVAPQALYDEQHNAVACAIKAIADHASKNGLTTQPQGSGGSWITIVGDFSAIPR